jgi:predicted RNA-binding Zn-ribbon protein involved in translation (DUF1610 family)
MNQPTVKDSGKSLEDCKHLNVFDPGVSELTPPLLWCQDCGALLLSPKNILLPKIFKHVFACPMCSQDPTTKRQIFIDGGFEYACSNCGFVPEGDISFRISNGSGVSLKAWNKGVWKIITGDLVELRSRYQKAFKLLQQNTKEG